MEIKNEMFSNTTQSTKKNEFTFHTFQMQQQCGRETDINVKVNGQQVIPADLQSLQSPIFNIHFHVPACEGKNIKIYLPKIQPVIHLHFDDLARKLEISREQNQEATFKAFQKLLSMTSSRVGDVKFHSQVEHKESVNNKKEFHYRDKLNETVSRNRDLDRTTPFFSDYTNGTGECASENSKRLESQLAKSVIGNCGMPDCCGSQNSIQENENAAEDYMSECDSDNEETLKRKFNLKEAVVVLEDVCETEYYKNMVAAGYIRDGTLDRNCDDDLLGRLEDAQEEENMSVSSEESESCYKYENELFSPESGSPPKSKEIGGNINPLNPSNQKLFKLAPSSPSSRTSTQSNSSTRLTESSERTISSLAKGCNFSDILTRFQMKKCNDPAKYNEDITKPEEAPSNERCNYESDETIPEHSSNSQPITMRASLHTSQSINRNSSQNCRDQPDLESCREDIINLNVSNMNPSDHNDTDPEDTALESPTTKLDLDARTSDEAASIARLEMISVISPTWQKRILTFPETRESNRLANLSVSGFRLDVYEEDMGRSNNGETGKNFKKKASEIESSTPKESSPSKKMKQSDGESQKSRTVSGTEEYIPLQSTGATKFAVAPLNKMNPYKTHDARNFKADMLYGKRINRFSSSDQLRIYQSKQEALKTQTN